MCGGAQAHVVTSTPRGRIVNGAMSLHREITDLVVLHADASQSLSDSIEERGPDIFIRQADSPALLHGMEWCAGLYAQSVE